MSGATMIVGIMMTRVTMMRGMMMTRATMMGVSILQVCQQQFQLN